MKLTNKKVIIQWIIAVILLISIVVWASNYYSEKVFYMDGNKYKEISEKQDNLKSYKSIGGKGIKVTAYENYKEIEIDGEIYKLEEKSENEFQPKFIITYPSEKKYIVKEVNHNFFLAIDENDESIIQPEEEYYPGILVTVAYDEYHEKQGILFLFILSLFIFGFSWLMFGSKSFQMLLFYISYGLYVNDPEPSDFYFISTKFGGVVGMILSVYTFFQSL